MHKCMLSLFVRASRYSPSDEVERDALSFSAFVSYIGGKLATLS